VYKFVQSRTHNSRYVYIYIITTHQAMNKISNIVLASINIVLCLVNGSAV